MLALAQSLNGEVSCALEKSARGVSSTCRKHGPSTFVDRVLRVPAQVLYSASEDCTVRVWHGTRVKALKGHTRCEVALLPLRRQAPRQIDLIKAIRLRLVTSALPALLRGCGIWPDK